MSVFVNKTVKNNPDGTSWCRCYESHRGGVLITAAGTTGTVSLYKVIDNQRVNLQTISISCNPPAEIGAVVGLSEFCVEVDSDSAVMLQVSDINASAVLPPDLTVQPQRRTHTTTRTDQPGSVAVDALAFAIASVNKQEFTVNGVLVVGDLIYQGLPLANSDTYPIVTYAAGAGDELIITETR